VEEVVNGTTFTQELRVGGHAELDALGSVATDGLADLLTGLHRDGGFVDDDAIAVFGLEGLRDFAGHLLDEAEVHGTIRLGRGGDRNENDVTVPDAIGGRSRELQATGLHVLGHNLLETGLEDGDLALEEHFDFLFVVVDTSDFVSDFGKASTGGESNVSGANDGEFHKSLRESGVMGPGL